MKTILSVLILLSFSSFGAAQSTSRNASDISAEQELKSIAQQLLDAVGAGDKSVWEKYVADDLIYTDENWHILTKKQLVDSLAPFPKGYSGSIRIDNFQSRINGDSAVLSYRALEEEFIFGQKLTPVYMVTDTYIKRSGRWQLIATHISVAPSERKPVAVSAEHLKAIAGTYELTSGITYTITLEDGKLLGQRTGRAKEELLPADENTWFPKGTTRGEKVFVQDANGRVTKMLDRRENNDLVWNRSK